MLSLMNDITDQPEWGRNILNKHFTDDWKSKALLRNPMVTHQLVDWVCLSDRSCRNLLRTLCSVSRK